jgi:hypothetical protein
VELRKKGPCRAAEVAVLRQRASRGVGADAPSAEGTRVHEEAEPGGAPPVSHLGRAESPCGAVVREKTAGRLRSAHADGAVAVFRTSKHYAKLRTNLSE